MVKIIFKNVGQGDSIILEWTSEDEKKTAIIDCNLYHSTNPVLNHIIQNKTKKIDFIILSHPHLDHFSGFIELLNYCRTHNIEIEKFLHTSIVSKDYLMSASRSVTADKKLFKLFSLLKEMMDNNEINVHQIDDNPFLTKSLGENFLLEILAPSSIEIDKYINGENYPFDEEESSCHPNANWLSTVIKISNNESTVLLTSDVESQVLSRLGKRNKGRIGNDKIILGQIPHHGSKKNLNKTFWTMRKRFNKTPTVISVGKNGHKHPSKEVLAFFKNLQGYQVERTDILKKTSVKSAEISQSLDVFSNIQIKNPQNQYSASDKTFTLTGNNCIIS